MNCPTCNAANSVRWVPPRYKCRECGHDLTRRKYERGVLHDWGRFLPVPPEVAKSADIEEGTWDSLN
jgi:hypothetical protein